jgi:hypothetical protein
MAKQAANRRKNGQFAPGNREGKKFEAGESGNVKGRPRRTKVSEALIAKLAETYQTFSRRRSSKRRSKATWPRSGRFAIEARGDRSRLWTSIWPSIGVRRPGNMDCQKRM